MMFSRTLFCCNRGQMILTVTNHFGLGLVPLQMHRNLAIVSTIILCVVRFVFQLPNSLSHPGPIVYEST
jgi:hypothetical protein